MIVYVALAIAATAGMFVGYWVRGALDEVQRVCDLIQDHHRAF